MAVPLLVLGIVMLAAGAAILPQVLKVYRRSSREAGYFHRPEEFSLELKESGLEVLGLFGLEGPARMLPDFDERWADPERRAHLLRMVTELESEPTVVGISPHLLGVCRKAV